MSICEMTSKLISVNTIILQRGKLKLGIFLAMSVRKHLIL